MTKNQAYDQGLSFSGSWERPWNRHLATEEAKEIRTKYKCRAVVVYDDGGYGIYVDQKYWDLRHLEDLERELSYWPTTITKLKDKYKKDLAEAEARQECIVAKIAEIKTNYKLN